MKKWHEAAIALKIVNPEFTAVQIASVVGRSPEAVQKALRRARLHGEFKMPDDVRMSETLGVTVETAVSTALQVTTGTLVDEDVPVGERARLAVALLNGPLGVQGSK